MPITWCILSQVSTWISIPFKWQPTRLTIISGKLSLSLSWFFPKLRFSAMRLGPRLTNKWQALFLIFYQVWFWDWTEQERKKKGEECEESSGWSPPGGIFHWMVVKVLTTRWTLLNKHTRSRLLALLPMAMLLMEDTLNRDDACGGRGVAFLA